MLQLVRPLVFGRELEVLPLNLTHPGQFPFWFIVLPVLPGPHNLKAPSALARVALVPQVAHGAPTPGDACGGLALVQGLKVFHVAPMVSALVPVADPAGNGVNTAIKPVPSQPATGLATGQIGALTTLPAAHKLPNTVGRDVVSKPPFVTTFTGAACVREVKETVSDAIARMVYA